MNRQAYQRQREALELEADGWTVVYMQELDYRKNLSKEEARQDWLKREQAQFAWCAARCRPTDFRFCSPNKWLFKDRSTALLFKLSCGL